jgi:predicted GTPase
VLAAGANFVLLGPERDDAEGHRSRRRVCAVRTGSGKSQTTRAIAQTLKGARQARRGRFGIRCRTGTSRRQRVQRYATLEDLDRFDTTIEEREEYEPHITSGTIIYAGVDYGDILKQAQAECDVLLWDGGTTICPSTRRTSTWWSPIRSAPGTRPATTPARPTCAWPA